VTRKKMRPSLNPGGLRVCRDPVDYALRSPLVDIVLPRKHLQPRRVNIKDEIALQNFLISAKEVSQSVVGGRNGQAGGPFLDLEFFLDQSADVEVGTLLNAGS